MYSRNSLSKFFIICLTLYHFHTDFELRLYYYLVQIRLLSSVSTCSGDSCISTDSPGNGRVEPMFTHDLNLSMCFLE